MKQTEKNQNFTASMEIEATDKISKGWYTLLVVQFFLEPKGYVEKVSISFLETQM